MRRPAEQPDPFSICLLISPSPGQPCLTVVVSSAISSHQKPGVPRDLLACTPLGGSLRLQLQMSAHGRGGADPPHMPFKGLLQRCSV